MSIIGDLFKETFGSEINFNIEQNKQEAIAVMGQAARDVLGLQTDDSKLRENSFYNNWIKDSAAEDMLEVVTETGGGYVNDTLNSMNRGSAIFAAYKNTHAGLASATFPAGVSDEIRARVIAAAQEQVQEPQGWRRLFQSVLEWVGISSVEKKSVAAAQDVYHAAHKATVLGLIEELGGAVSPNPELAEKQYRELASHTAINEYASAVAASVSGGSIVDGKFVAGNSGVALAMKEGGAVTMAAISTSPDQALAAAGPIIQEGVNKAKAEILMAQIGVFENLPAAQKAHLQSMLEKGLANPDKATQFTEEEAQALAKLEETQPEAAAQLKAKLGGENPDTVALALLNAAKDIDISTKGVTVDTEHDSGTKLANFNAPQRETSPAPGVS